MSVVLRHFQEDLSINCDVQWYEHGNKVVMPVLPTGGGKTAVMAHKALQNQDHCGAILAHRAELVGQISIAMGRNGLMHGLVASTAVRNSIVARHMEEFGRSMIDVRAPWRVGGVDTILNRDADRDPWFKSCKYVFEDEGHHVLAANKWGKAYMMFPNDPFGLFPTATPKRGDRKGLGRHAHGLVDALLLGPNMGYMIQQRYLTPYKIVAPDPASLGLYLDDVELTGQGEFKEEAKKRTKAATKIIGSVVSTYMQHAMGRRGVTFAIDIEEAFKIAAEFNRCGVPAAVVTGEMQQAERDNLIGKLARGELLQLVNVDLFGEGFDLPAIECVSFARPTASYSLYVQQFGRALRLMIDSFHARQWDTYSIETRNHVLEQSGKPFAWIFDHVGNVVRHNGPPDRPVEWSLDADMKGNKKASKPEPYTTCANTVCLSPFSRVLPACPFCGAELPIPTGRSRPEEVDGDLTIYTDEMLAKLWGSIQAIDADPVIHQGMSLPVRRSIAEAHRKSFMAQQELRAVIAEWAGHFAGESDRVRYRRFFHQFGIDVAEAKGLKHQDAVKLMARVQDNIGYMQGDGVAVIVSNG